MPADSLPAQSESFQPIFLDWGFHLNPILCILRLMNMNPTLRSMIYIVVAFGCALAMATAVVPHYEHHALWFSVLLIGIIPYLTYLVLTEIQPSTALMLGGLAVLGLDAIVKFFQRFIAFDQYAGGAIYYIPIAASIVMLIISLFNREHDRSSPPGDRVIEPGHAQGDER